MTHDLNQRFRARPTVHSRRFEQEAVVLDVGAGKYFSVDEVGAFIWEQLTAGKTHGETVAAVVAAYEVDEATASDDVARLARELVAAGLIEVCV